MQDLDNSQSPSRPTMAPPTDYQEPFLQPQASNWPKVIGIIAIIFGAGGVLASIFGLLAPLLNDKLMEILPAEDRAALESQPDPTALMNALTVLQLALGVVLIVAGAKLIARRVSGPRLARTWASIKAVIVVVLAIVTYPAAKQAAEQAAKIQNQQSLPQSMQDTIIIFGLIIGLIWSLALPVFMLIWFSRGKIKHEVAEWSE
jgi:hypothetical protein